MPGVYYGNTQILTNQDQHLNPDIVKKYNNGEAIDSIEEISRKYVIGSKALPTARNVKRAWSNWKKGIVVKITNSEKGKTKVVSSDELLVLLKPFNLGDHVTICLKNEYSGIEKKIDYMVVADDIKDIDLSC